MAEFTYTSNPASLKRFLDHIQAAGVPEKVTIKYLEKVGFKTTNDRYIISVLKFIGFLDSSGVPTSLWQKYRNRKTSRAILAGAVRSAYSDLFGTYPDAYRKDNEALRNYFSAHTKVAASTLACIVQTFKALCDLSDFETAEPVVPGSQADVEGAKPKRAGSDSKITPELPSAASLPAVNINIQLQLPATADGEIYDRLFAALKKHLLSPQE